MKRVTVLAGLLALVFVVVGCGDKHESATKEMLGNLEDMNSVLDGVKNEADLDAAKPELDEIGERIKALTERMKKMGKPPKAREEALESKYKERTEKVIGDLTKNMMRLATVKGAGDLGKIFENMKAAK